MKYEVLKLKTGQEICGMVSHMESTVAVTLPMICQLTRVSPVNTLATFIPYAPLSKDAILTIEMDSILHISNMNDQFIPFYDEASSKWLGMVEEGNIPLTNVIPSPKEFLKEKIAGMMEHVTDADFDAWEQEEQEELAMEEFMASTYDGDKKIIH
jgi:hypothetical protein